MRKQHSNVPEGASHLSFYSLNGAFVPGASLTYAVRERVEAARARRVLVGGVIATLTLVGFVAFILLGVT